MKPIELSVCDTVRLRADVPTLWLRRGEVGVVRSRWFAPTVACEVEFHPNGQPVGVRALLFPEQLEVVDPCRRSS